MGVKLEDNNRGNVKEFVVKDKGKDGKTKKVKTRPDSLGDNNSVVHDHKHFSKGDQYQDLDSQMRAQRKVAKDSNGTHVVTMSSSQPNLKGKPPKPRPSGPLAKDSDVYYTDKDGDVTHKWGKDKKTKEMGWQPVT